MAFSVREASERILAAITALPPVAVPLRDSLGLVLAEDVVSPIEHPPWDNSSMDGYAVRAADVASAAKSAPVELPVLETVRAGQRPTLSVERGTAIRVMTGAPVPNGADSVIRVEDTDGGETRVAIRDARDAGRNVRPRGEDPLARLANAERHLAKPHSGEPHGDGVLHALHGTNRHRPVVRQKAEDQHVTVRRCDVPGERARLRD